MEEDLAQEIMLREEMDMVKRKVGHKTNSAPFIERMRGYVAVEKGDSDFQMIVNFNELQMKSFKNAGKRLEPKQLGIVMYGRNLRAADGSINPTVKESLQCARTHLTAKKKTRGRDTVTDQEIEMLEDKYMVEFLDTKDGKQWEHTGYGYQNVNNIHANETLLQHPNRELLITNYLAEQNEDIGAYNRKVQKEWNDDMQKYE